MTEYITDLLLLVGLAFCVDNEPFEDFKIVVRNQ